MRIGVPDERTAHERRVAITPDVVKTLIAAGHEVVVEANAGADAGFADAAFSDAGARSGASWGDVSGCDLIVTIAGLSDERRAALGDSATVLGMVDPLGSEERTRELAGKGSTVFSMELVPRISRAQSMDALSSQSTVAGYRAVLLGAMEMPRMFPMLMTAAGTIPPAKVFVVGAGVAGLQAIATARRLGAVVSAYDTRPVVKEQVESLGATFVELDLGDAQTEAGGGYAAQLTAEQVARQTEQMAAAVTAADVVITTALVPGRPAPRIVTRAMVEGMRAGAVIVDLAGESGGNCELSSFGERIVHNGVTIVAPRNLPSDVPDHASRLFAKNVANLIALLAPEGELAPDYDDEVVTGCLLARGGDIAHGFVRERFGMSNVEVGA